MARELSHSEQKDSVVLVVSEGEGEFVFGPFEKGLVMNDCAIWEPGGDEDHAVACWAYGEDGPGGWEVQDDPANLWPSAHVRSTRS